MPPRRTPNPQRTVICFVRHGTTPTTGKVLPGRAKGLHLSDQGVIEAQRTGERLAALGSVQAVYCSPLSARETAAIVARCVGRRPQIEKGLLECDFGDWTGAELSALRKLPEWQTIMHHPSGFRFPNGESFGEMRLRIAGAIDRLVARHQGELVVAVSHADPIKIAIGEALGVPLDLVQRTVVSPASVSVVAYGADVPAVLTVNSASDLAGLGIANTPRSCRKAKMSELFDLSTPDRIVVGVVGEPGQRAFYLQARSESLMVTLKMEKLQVAALADHLGHLLQDLARPGHLPEDDEMQLEAFDDETFAVGTISVAYDAAIDRIMVIIESRPILEEGPEYEARFLITREQAASIAIRGASLVEAGRPPCPLCGYPLDPRGHACPKTNGHRPPTL